MKLFKSLSDKATANEVWALVKKAEDARFRQERQWYINDRFYGGEHHVVYDRLAGKIENIRPKKGQILRTVPKTTRQIDAMINMLVSGDFKWTVKPPLYPIMNQDPEEMALKVGRWLKCKFAELDMAWQIVEIALLGFKYPIAYFWPGYDAELQEFYCDIYDAFDIYFDKPNITDPEQANVMIKTFIKDIEELAANPHYSNVDGVKPSGRIAVSDIKDAREQEKYGGVEAVGENGARCAEIWKKKYKVKNGRMIISMDVMTVAENTVIRESENVPMDRFPIVAYKPRPGPIYSPAWIELFVSLNKSLDSFAASLEGYAQQLAKPRLLTQKGQVIDVEETGTAMLVQWSAGVPPTWMQPPNLPKELPIYTGMLEKWIEEMGVSSLNMGQVPTQVKAWRAIETLKEADYANLTTAVLALKKTLSEVAFRFIQLGARHMTEPNPVMEDRRDDRFMVAGQPAVELANLAEEPLPEGTVVLDESCKAMVEIENGLGHTDQAKKDTLGGLFDRGVIDGGTLLEGYKFGNIAEILEKARAEKDISMIDTNDFKMLPPELQKQILSYVLQSNQGEPGQPGQLGQPEPGAMGGGEPM